MYNLCLYSSQSHTACVFILTTQESCHRTPKFLYSLRVMECRFISAEMYNKNGKKIPITELKTMEIKINSQSFLIYSSISFLRTRAKKNNNTSSHLLKTFFLFSW